MTFVATASCACPGRDGGVRRRRGRHGQPRPRRVDGGDDRPHAGRRGRRLRRPPGRLRRLPSGHRRRARDPRRRGALHRVDLPGRPVGSLADVTTFSFFPTKNLTTAEGGAVVSPDHELARRAHEFHSSGWSATRRDMRTPTRGPGTRRCTSSGLNYRLPDVLGALGLSQLRRLAAFKPRRAEIIARYRRPGRRRRPAAARRARGRRPDLAPLPAAGPATAAAARSSSGCAPPASASRSTTCRSTGTRCSRTWATGAACAPTPRSSTRRRSRCRCSPA